MPITEELCDILLAFAESVHTSHVVAGRAIGLHFKFVCVYLPSNIGVKAGAATWKKEGEGFCGRVCVCVCVSE